MEEKNQLKGLGGQGHGGKVKRKREGEGWNGVGRSWENGNLGGKRSSSGQKAEWR
jgi:hypothetical protein